MATQTALNGINEKAHGQAQAGAIALDKKGNVGIHFTTPTMAWTYRQSNKIHSGIRRGEHFVEDA